MLINMQYTEHLGMLQQGPGQLRSLKQTNRNAGVFLEIMSASSWWFNYEAQINAHESNIEPTPKGY